jgi:starvation-inducible DNA-binding protein
MVPKLGLSEEQRNGIINMLNTVLADEQVLYAKLRNYHWNVVGAQFLSLHKLFEEQYQTIADVADTIAERVRAHGGWAVGTLEEFLEQARLEEKRGDYPDARGMVFNIVRDHEFMVRNLREDAHICDEAYQDLATQDLLVDLIQKHEKMAWMLRAFIEGEPVHRASFHEEELSMPKAPAG